MLVYNPSLGGGGERTVYGGLKTKDVDVVVTKEGIGPVFAVSCKGAIGAFRNLTNRMEEAVGDCTNLHIAYPPPVCGYLLVMRANRAEEVGSVPGGPGAEQSRAVRPLVENDVAIDGHGQPVESVRRFHAALRELADRLSAVTKQSRSRRPRLSLSAQGKSSTSSPIPAARCDSNDSSRRSIANKTSVSFTPRPADMDYDPRISS